MIDMSKPNTIKPWKSINVNVLQMIDLISLKNIQCKITCVHGFAYTRSVI